MLGHVAGVARIKDSLPDRRVELDVGETPAAPGVRDGVLGTQQKRDSSGDGDAGGERQEGFDED